MKGSCHKSLQFTQWKENTKIDLIFDMWKSETTLLKNMSVIKYWSGDVLWILEYTEGQNLAMTCLRGYLTDFLTNQCMT